MEKNESSKVFLSVIIPAYKADETALAQNLGMINAQVNVDFGRIEVLVVDDATPKEQALPTSFFQQFKNLSIHVLRCTVNGGPGVARQIGIDYAQGRYVMFADADDSLYDVSVLSQMMEALEAQESKNAPLDILMADWTEELKTQGSTAVDQNGQPILRPDRFAYAKHENDGTWMHGKAYRRAFLTENKIAFDDLRVHEDRRFNAIALALSKNTMRIPITAYVWKFRPNSITRAKGAAYSYNSIAESVDAADRAYSELIGKHSDQMDLQIFGAQSADAPHKFNPSQGIVQTVYYTYFIVQSWVGRVPDANALNEIEHRLGAFYLKYKDIYAAYPIQLGYSDYALERDAVVKQMGPFMEKETLPVFLWRIEAAAKMDAKQAITATAGATGEAK